MLNDISIKLYDYFVGNRNAYAEQTAKGYNTIYKSINSTVIQRMLKDKNSLLTYQFRNEEVKWICFDFDIKKEICQSEEFEKDNNKFFILLFETVNKFCTYLKGIKIDFLLEFSGNRGFHIWIIFDDFVSSFFARKVLEYIKSNCGTLIDNTIIGLDEFPKSDSRNRSLGFGVKLPLSLHKKSNSYSYFLDTNENVISNNLYINKLTNNFLKTQIDILNGYKPVDFTKLLLQFNINVDDFQQNKSITSYVKVRKPILNEYVDLSTVLFDLKKCNILNSILIKYPEGTLNEKERTLIVGVLNRLHLKDDKSYGKKLLKEFFSKLPNYQEKLTEKKLENLNLYPITCQYLQSVFPNQNCPCNSKTSELIYKTPIELITSIDIETITEDIFELREDDFNRIIQSQIKYLKNNDEIDLSFQIEELENSKPSKYLGKYLYYLDNVKELDDFYTFKRFEENDKIRELITLSNQDNILTTAFTKILDSIYFTEISSNSYGYKFENGFPNNNIFSPWLKQWNVYIKKLEKLIFNPDFYDYYVIKLDLQSFYSSIDLDRLKLKLLNGGTENAAKKIQELDFDSRERYYNICKTLISFCKRISPSNKGVPQGPVFARYLAEIYLLQLDSFIEKGLSDEEHYFRYVDDIFIFIKKEKNLAQDFLDKLINFIETHDLAINQKNEKFFFGTTIDYQDEFYNYKDKTKYFIDKSYKNTTIITTIAKKNAINDLFKLIETHSKEIKSDNLNFFLTHFDDNLLIREKKKELEKYVLNLKKGRGSLFRNFYNFFFELLHEESGFFPPEISQLEGLNKTAFLNSLLKNIITKQFSSEQLHQIKEILISFLNSDISNTDKELIFYIMLKDNNLFVKEYLDSSNFNILNKVIANESKKELPSDVFSYLVTNIEHISFDEKIDLIFDVIFKNTIENQSINDLCDLFFNSILEQIKDNDHKRFVLSYLQNKDISILNDNIYRFYQLLCLFSITKIQSETLAKLRTVWENFISFSNSHNSNIDGYLHNWVRYVTNIDIDESNINTIIVSKQEDSFLNIKQDKHGFFSEFYNGVIYSLFIKLKSSLEFDISVLLKTDAKEVINKLVNDDKLVFLGWLSDNKTELYPNRDICLNNIIENDRLVLKQDNKILVRLKKQIDNCNTIPDTNYTYLRNISEIDEKAFNNLYKSIIYEFESTDYLTLENSLSSKIDLIQVVDLILSVKNSIYKFKELYHPNLTKFPNIVNGDINLSKDFFPLIPYSIFDNKPVINENKTESENNEGKFLGNLLNVVKSNKIANLSLLGYPHPNNISSKNLLREEKTEDSLIPITNKSDIAARYEYLETFSKNVQLTNHLIKSAFTIEYAKLHTIQELASKRFKSEHRLKDNEIVPKVIYDILYNYHSLYKEKEHFKKLIFDITTEPKEDDIVILYKSIANSIDRFINKLISNSVCRFENIITYELLKLENLCIGFWKTPENMTISKIHKIDSALDLSQLIFAELIDYKLCSILYENETKLKLNNKTILYTDNLDDLKNIYILKAFKDEEYEIKQLTIPDIYLITNQPTYYKNIDNKYLIIVIDNTISKSYTTITERFEEYNDRKIHLDCYENPIEVDRIILNSKAKFSKALEILEHHYYKSEVVKSKNELYWHLVNWLRLFSNQPEDSRILLEVIAAHQSIKPEWLAPFVKEIAKHQNQTNSIVLSFKTLEDANGLHRILFNFYNDRTIISKISQFKDEVLKITEPLKNNKTLVVLTDIGLSGKQLSVGLDYYFNRELQNNNGEIYLKENWEKYYEITISEFDKFRENIKSFKKIKFVLVAYTKRFMDLLISFVKDKISNDIDISFFPEKPNLDYSLCILPNNTNIKKDSNDSFVQLTQDLNKLNRLFKLPQDIRREYVDKLSIDENKNLVVRINSVPNKVCMIFMLDPKTDTKPLFNRIIE